RLPAIVAEHGDAQPSLLTLIEAVEGGEAVQLGVDGGPLEALPVGRGVEASGCEQRSVDDRRVDLLALASAVAVIQRLDHGDGRQEAVAEVAPGTEAPVRPPAACAAAV